MNSKVVSDALIQGTELIEQNYGSVVNAPASSLRWLHKIASRMYTPSRTHATIERDYGLEPCVTHNYKLFKAWHELCYLMPLYQIERDCNISRKIFTRLRSKKYTYCFQGHQLMDKTIAELVNSIKKHHINGPQNIDEYKRDRIRYDLNRNTKYPGVCRNVYCMRKLILRTNHGDVLAKIPDDAR